MVDGDDAELEEEDLLTSRGCKQGVYSCTAAADVLWVAGADSNEIKNYTKCSIISY